MYGEGDPRSNRTRIAGLRERWLWWSAIWGTRGMFVSAVILVGHVEIGWSLTELGSPRVRPNSSR